MVAWALACLDRPQRARAPKEASPDPELTVAEAEARLREVELYQQKTGRLFLIGLLSLVTATGFIWLAPIVSVPLGAIGGGALVMWRGRLKGRTGNERTLAQLAVAKAKLAELGRAVEALKK
ncbi:MAG: hypothetical protein U0271_22825 [Polyangiaceae bacterium]